MLLRRIFQKPIRPKELIDFQKEELKKVIEINRKTLLLIESWIDENAFQNSFFNYGVPDYIKKHLNKEVNEKPTYSDYLVLIANKYFEKVNYLEIGVSVGKNFFQVINAVPNGTFVGYDIEELNPIIKNKLSNKITEEWDTMQGSIKTNKSSLSEFEYKNRQVSYLSADVWDANSWKKLFGRKFNLIFSDALHTPEAILFEFEMLLRYNLLADQFVIMWDDLVGEMQNSFYEILKRYNKQYKIQDVYLLKVNGWVGDNEEPHSVGVIANFSL